jgi:hypothetical protein
MADGGIAFLPFMRLGVSGRFAEGAEPEAAGEGEGTIEVNMDVITLAVGFVMGFFVGGVLMWIMMMREILKTR